jgi:hypothetical protein
MEYLKLVRHYLGELASQKNLGQAVQQRDNSLFVLHQLRFIREGTQLMFDSLRDKRRNTDTQLGAYRLQGPFLGFSQLDLTTLSFALGAGGFPKGADVFGNVNHAVVLPYITVDADLMLMLCHWGASVNVQGEEPCGINKSGSIVVEICIPDLAAREFMDLFKGARSGCLVVVVFGAPCVDGHFFNTDQLRKILVRQPFFVEVCFEFHGS